MKKDTLKIVLVAIVTVMAIGAIVINNNMNKVTKDSKKFKKEYESINNTIREKDGKKIREVSIPESNPIKYITASKLSDKIDDKETFLVYFGFSDCPWCRSIIETLIETAKENNIKQIYYVDVKEIRDVYELDSENKPTLSVKGSNGYLKLIKKLDNILDDYTLTTNEDKKIEVGEKRIYAPNVVAVVKGKAKSLETGISEKETDPYMKLTASIKKDTKKSFEKIMKYVK